MKRRVAVSVVLLSALLAGASLGASAEEEASAGAGFWTEQALSEDGAQEKEQETVLRNTVFTTTEQMQQMMGASDPEEWSVAYLSEVERYYWNFSASGEQEKKEMSMNLVSNAYQNLEMFLDNGYLLDYNELADYAADYLVRKGEEDAYYKILTDCLNNPYLLNKPEAQVTDYTYNGRDYSMVFDPDYYYDNNPDLQLSIGFNPPELLRHFVEIGITQGRKGNDTLDMDAYIVGVDAQIALETAGSQAPGVSPAVAKYSYSRANYYGKLLGHYDYTSLYEPGQDAEAPYQEQESGIEW